MAGTTNPFLGIGPIAKAKLVILGAFESLPDDVIRRVRSLNLEHVSPSRLPAAEISRRAGSPAAEEVNRLALMRRWFFARKPDAGFLLTEFPATLLQARVFDEWLETRNESLDAVVIAPGAPVAVIEHYEELGLLHELVAQP